VGEKGEEWGGKEEGGFEISSSRRGADLKNRGRLARCTGRALRRGTDDYSASVYYNWGGKRGEERAVKERGKGGTRKASGGFWWKGAGAEKDRKNKDEETRCVKEGGARAVTLENRRSISRLRGSKGREVSEGGDWGEKGKKQVNLALLRLAAWQRAAHEGRRSIY